MGSTNGTLVNEKATEGCQLSDGDLVQVGTTIFKFLSATNLESKYHEEIYRLTTIDGLTKAFNKRHFMEACAQELERAYRYGRVLSLAIFDIDHFKKINDTHGHLAGDHVLRELAHQVAAKLRSQDIFARYGGEEFAIILPEVDGDGARIACEKIRGVVEAHTFSFGDQTIPVTISIGICTVRPKAPPGAKDVTAPLDGEDASESSWNVERLVDCADRNLYAAKQSGRNRVVA